MGTIDDILFRRAGALDCGQSDYNLSVTTCCSTFVVYDCELGRVYYDADDLSKVISLFTSNKEAQIDCPVCGEAKWDFQQLAEWPKEETEWQWAYHPDPRIVADWQKNKRV